MTLHGFSGRSFTLAATFPLALVASPAQQSNNGKTSASSNGQHQTAEVRTEKIKFKQEFGPQAVASRGDHMAVMTPQNGSNNPGPNPAGGAASANRQEFGPSVQGPRRQNLTTLQPASPNTSQQPTGGSTNRTTSGAESKQTIQQPPAQGTTPK